MSCFEILDHALYHQHDNSQLFGGAHQKKEERKSY